MDKKIITTLNLHRCLGLTCQDCPLKGQGMNQKQFCSFYKKSHDEARPKFCKVENIEITEGLELPEPVKYNRDNEPMKLAEFIGHHLPSDVKIDDRYRQILEKLKK